MAKIAGSSFLTLAAAYAVRQFLAKLSRDRVDRAHDTAEIDVIGILRSENKMLRDALTTVYAERLASVEELGGLRTEVRLLRKQIDGLQATVARLETSMGDDNE
jgi:hypothetical protein